MKRGLLCLLAVTTIGACGSTGDSPDAGNGGNGCQLTSDCSEGRVCIEGTCAPPGSRMLGGQCTATRDCQPSLYCNPAGQRCATAGSGRVNDPCLSDGECTAGLRCNYTGFNGYCIEQVKTGDVGATCTAQTDCITGLYCGRENLCTKYATAFPAFGGVTCPADTGPFHSYFEVPRSVPLADFYRQPFPSDLRINAQDKLDLTEFAKPGPTPLGPDLVKLYTDALVADFDGFSPMAPVAFRFSKPIDYGMFAGSALGNVIYVDLTTGVGLFSYGFTWTPDRTHFSCENFLTVYPAYPPGFDESIDHPPLAFDHTYGVMLLNGNLRSEAGASPVQDPDLAAVLSDTPPPASDAALLRAHGKFAPLRAFMKTQDPPISPAVVMNATVFKTADPTVHMKRLAAALPAAPPALSSLFECGVTTGADPCDDGTEARRCGASDPAFVEIHGKVTLPIFQSGTAPYLTPADGGGLNESGGSVSKVRDEPVCFALTMPRGAAPAAGWPLVLYSHGTNGSFRSFISDGIAAQMAGASTKAAVVSFDSVEHGARRAGSTRKPEELVFNVLNPRAARDNYLQGAADILTMAKLPGSTAPAGWTGPAIKLAPKVVFFGHSQGSTHGALALPFGEDAPAAVLSGAGANLTASLLSKTSPRSIKDGLEFLLGDVVDFNHPMMAIWQTYFDRVDPANFAGALIRQPLAGHMPKHVYMSWGHKDTFTPGLGLRVPSDPNSYYTGPLYFQALLLHLNPLNPITDDQLQPVGGLPPVLARPVSKNYKGVTAVVVQYDPPAAVDGHFVASDTPAAIADWKAFITSFFATGTPTIP